MPTFTIPCIISDQRQNQEGPRFALFTAPAGQIVQWAGIRRRHENNQGTQRALNKSKVTALQHFLQRDPRNTIAPAITITLQVAEGQLQPAG